MLKWLRLVMHLRAGIPKLERREIPTCFSLFVESILERPEISTTKDDIAAAQVGLIRVTSSL
jgi:hypothetical protein